MRNLCLKNGNISFLNPSNLRFSRGRFTSDKVVPTPNMIKRAAKNELYLNSFSRLTIVNTEIKADFESVLDTKKISFLNKYQILNMMR